MAQSRRAVQQIEVPLPPDPYWHAPEFRSLRIGQDAYQTISETRRGCRAVRLQSFGIGGRHCWSVQWWTFKVAWYMQANVPEWCLSHEVLRPTLVQAAVRFAQAEAVLTRRKSVRT